jgi:spermidine synthase
MLNDSSPDARVGAIGLGSGALSAYANAGQVWTFYEIDPAVAEIAATREYFTYLQDTEAEWEIVLGDGRLSIAGADPGRFDLIVVDAYGSDAVPVHMITREAVELFASKLAPDGVIAFHISNQFLDLEPVLGGIAGSLGYAALVRDDNAITPAEQARGRVASTWAAVARLPRTLDPLRERGTWRALRVHPGARVWTDSFTNLLGIIRWE